MLRPIVSYIRVSTAQQGKSGLGLEAQRAALARFAETEGLEATGEFVEIESGKGADALDRRPQLAAALAEARKRKCAVVVAKLDRLSRDVHFISGLMTHRVPFVVAELVWRFQNSNHRRHSKSPQFAGSKPRSELSGFMESVF
jgi:DNA invertase Pin-like site-specific DNA recombinase